MFRPERMVVIAAMILVNSGCDAAPEIDTPSDASGAYPSLDGERLSSVRDPAPAGCNDECNASTGVAESVGTYVICSPYFDADTCQEPGPTQECLSEPSAGVCQDDPVCEFAAPVPISPADGAIVAPGVISFCWRRRGNPIGYNISISKSATATVHDNHVVSGSSRSRFCIPSGEFQRVHLRGSVTGATCRDFQLEPGEYFWHVIGASARRAGQWSAPRKLIVQ